MAEFMIKFFICNIFISIIIGIFLLVKHLLRNYLTSRPPGNEAPSASDRLSRSLHKTAKDRIHRN